MTATEGAVTSNSVEPRIRQFVLEYFYVTDPDALTDDTSLIDSGLVDSTGMMGVILYLESEFGIQVGDRDATPENLGSIARIAEFVARKRQTDGT
jgi:acyl carrier protein